MGDKTVNTQSLPDAESVIVTRQYLGGSLKSQMEVYGLQANMKI